MPGVVVVGDGGWGTAIAIHLARKGVGAGLWSHDAEYARHLAEHRANPKFLPGHEIPAPVVVPAPVYPVYPAPVYAPPAVAFGYGGYGGYGYGGSGYCPPRYYRGGGYYRSGPPYGNAYGYRAKYGYWR